MRQLVEDLEQLQTAEFRIPDWKVFVYDIVSTRTNPVPETIGRIISGDSTITPPLDLSPFVLNVARTEESSDFVQGNLQGDAVAITIADKRLTYDPVDGSQKRWLRPGNVIRIYEGEARRRSYANETFSGSTVGVAGTYTVLGGEIAEASKLVVREGSISGTLLTLGTDYTVDEFNGTITGVGSKWVAATNYYVSYEARVVPVKDWAITFTGTISGRAGAEERDRSGNAMLQVAAVDRMAALLKIVTTSAAYPQGTTFQEMMRALLEDDVNLSPDEFDLQTVGNNNLTSQVTTQLVDESPILSIAKVAFVDGFIPRFRGDGVLTLRPTTVTQAPDVVYEDMKLFIGFSRPFNPLDGPNEVEVLGLDANQSRVDQPRQVVASASLTLGFFAGDASINLKFSDDETMQASNTRLRVLQSVTGALIPFGAEDYTPRVDPDGGARGGRIEVAGAFYAPLVTVLYASRLATSLIPDNVVALGAGVTIPVGRVLEGIAAIAIATIQATIGRGDYEIVGDPYEYVFREIRRVARVANTPVEDTRSIRIENHLLDNDGAVDEVQNVANRELLTARKRANLYTVRMRHDLRLEPYDKFRLPDGREFGVLSINRTIGRGEETEATLQVYETTAGVFP